jgi:hypothetical protein
MDWKLVVIYFEYEIVIRKPENYLFPPTQSAGIAALTSSSTLPRRLAPEQGTGPDTAVTTTKLRLLALPTARVSAAIMPKNK